jgi:hypothetical protein
MKEAHNNAFVLDFWILLSWSIESKYSISSTSSNQSGRCQHLAPVSARSVTLLYVMTY